MSSDALPAAGSAAAGGSGASNSNASADGQTEAAASAWTSAWVPVPAAPSANDELTATPMDTEDAAAGATGATGAAASAAEGGASDPAAANGSSAAASASLSRKRKELSFSVASLDTSALRRALWQSGGAFDTAEQLYETAEEGAATDRRAATAATTAANKKKKTAAAPRKKARTSKSSPSPSPPPAAATAAAFPPPLRVPGLGLPGFDRSSSGVSGSSGKSKVKRVTTFGYPSHNVVQAPPHSVVPLDASPFYAPEASIHVPLPPPAAAASSGAGAAQRQISHPPRAIAVSQLPYCRRVWQSTPQRQLFPPLQLTTWLTENDKQEYTDRARLLHARREDSKRHAAAIAQGRQPPPPSVPPSLSMTPMFDRLREQHLSLSLAYSVPSFPNTRYRSGSGLESLLHHSQTAVLNYDAATKAYHQRMDAIAQAKHLQSIGAPNAPQVLPALPYPLPPPPPEYKFSLTLHLYQHGFALNGGSEGDKNFHRYSRANAAFLRQIDQGEIPALLAPMIQAQANVTGPLGPAAGAMAAAAGEQALGGALPPLTFHFYDGFLLAELRDYRAVTPTMRAPSIRRMLLRPTLESIQTDALMLAADNAEMLAQAFHAGRAARERDQREREREQALAAQTDPHPEPPLPQLRLPDPSTLSPAAAAAALEEAETAHFRQCVFSAEALVLRSTRRNLCLDPSPRVMQVANLLHYNKNRSFVSGRLSRGEAVSRAIEVLQNVGETEDMMATAPPPTQSVRAQMLDAETVDQAAVAAAAAAMANATTPGNGWYEHEVEVDEADFGAERPALELPPAPLAASATPAMRREHLERLRAFLHRKTSVFATLQKAASAAQPAASAAAATAAAVASPSPAPVRTPRLSRSRAAIAGRKSASPFRDVAATVDDSAEPPGSLSAALATGARAQPAGAEAEPADERKEQSPEDAPVAPDEDAALGVVIEGKGPAPQLQCLAPKSDATNAVATGAAASAPAPAAVDPAAPPTAPSTTTSTTTPAAALAVPAPSPSTTLALLNYASFVHHTTQSLANHAINSTVLDPALRSTYLSGKFFALQNAIPPATIGEPGGDPNMRGYPVAQPFVPAAQAATIPFPQMPIVPSAPVPAPGSAPPPPTSSSGAAALPTSTPPGKKHLVHISSVFAKVAPGDRPLRNVVPRANEWLVHVFSPSASSIPPASAAGAASQRHYSRQIQELLIHALPTSMSGSQFSGQFEGTVRLWTAGDPRPEVVSFPLGNEDAKERFLAQFKRQAEKDLRGLMVTPWVTLQPTMPEFALPQGWFADAVAGKFVRNNHHAHAHPHPHPHGHVQSGAQSVAKQSGQALGAALGAGGPYRGPSSSSSSGIYPSASGSTAPSYNTPSHLLGGPGAGAGPGPAAGSGGMSSAYPPQASRGVYPSTSTLPPTTMPMRPPGAGSSGGTASSSTVAGGSRGGAPPAGAGYTYASTSTGGAAPSGGVGGPYAPPASYGPPGQGASYTSSVQQQQYSSNSSRGAGTPSSQQQQQYATAPSYGSSGYAPNTAGQMSRQSSSGGGGGVAPMQQQQQQQSMRYAPSSNSGQQQMSGQSGQMRQPQQQQPSASYTTPSHLQSNAGPNQTSQGGSQSSSRSYAPPPPQQQQQQQQQQQGGYALAGSTGNAGYSTPGSQRGSSTLQQQQQQQQQQQYSYQASPTPSPPGHAGYAQLPSSTGTVAYNSFASPPPPSSRQVATPGTGTSSTSTPSAAGPGAGYPPYKEAWDTAANAQQPLQQQQQQYGGSNQQSQGQTRYTQQSTTTGTGSSSRSYSQPTGGVQQQQQQQYSNAAYSTQTGGMTPTSGSGAGGSYAGTPTGTGYAMQYNYNLQSPPPNNMYAQQGSSAPRTSGQQQQQQQQQQQRTPQSQLQGYANYPANTSINKQMHPQQ